MTPLELFNANQGIAGRVLCRLGLRDEDSSQVALIGLWKACQSYDTTQSQFSTFAWRCVWNELSQHLQRQQATKRGHGAKHVSLDMLRDRAADHNNSTRCDEPESREPAPYAGLMAEDTRRRARRLINKASVKDRPMLRSRYLDGMSWGELAKIHNLGSAGFAASRVAKAINRIRRAVLPVTVPDQDDIDEDYDDGGRDEG